MVKKVNVNVDVKSEKATIDLVDGPSYSVSCRCTNCKYGDTMEQSDFRIAIPYGVLVAEYLLKIQCPYCGCCKLVLNK